MVPRLVFVCMVGTVLLTGCKSHASLMGFGDPAAINTLSNEHAERQQSPQLLGFGRFFAERAPAPAEVDWSEIEVTEEVDEPEVLPPYELGTGDRIRIFIYGQPNLSRVYTVDGEGRISVPLVGSVLARGRTTRMLEGIIRGSLARNIVKDPIVSIEVAVYRPFYILGEVRTPGQFPYVYGMTVQAAVATAGGYSPRADQRKIQIARTIHDVPDIIAADPMDFIHPGDTITINERWF